MNAGLVIQYQGEHGKYTSMVLRWHLLLDEGNVLNKSDVYVRFPLTFCLTCSVTVISPRSWSRSREGSRGPGVACFAENCYPACEERDQICRSFELLGVGRLRWCLREW
ncbi:hypothetical protein M758_10G125400 [Ceratodon purpureus]|nr:hypothetical protein M758_10G125400 [Ceratodon purpureus]